jgi:hypothetical protein
MNNMTSDVDYISILYRYCKILYSATSEIAGGHDSIVNSIQNS